MLIDYDVLEKTVVIDGVTVTFSPLSVENYNRVAMYQTLSKEADPDKYYSIIKKAVLDHVKKIEGAKVRENKEVRDATAGDLVKHSGFYNFTLSLIAAMFDTGEVEDTNQKNLESPVENISQQEQ